MVNLAEQQMMINAKLNKQMITRNQNTRKVAIVVCTATRRPTTRNVYHWYSCSYYVFDLCHLSYSLIGLYIPFSDCNEHGFQLLYIITFPCPWPVFLNFVLSSDSTSICVVRGTTGISNFCIPLTLDLITYRKKLSDMEWPCIHIFLRCVVIV